MENGALMGKRTAGNAYAIQDDAAVLAFFLDHKDDAADALVHAVMTNESFWGENLTLLPGLEETVKADLACILEKGAYEAMRSTL